MKEYPKILYLDGDSAGQNVIVWGLKEETEENEKGYWPIKAPPEEADEDPLLFTGEDAP